MIQNKAPKKEFDQTICFTFFAPWVESIRGLAQEDPEKAVDAFLILSDYCLHGIEPEPQGNPWGFTWPIVAGEARRSIANRRRGFGAENTAQTESIKEYYQNHPEATQREIAEAVGCSLGKVGKVIKAVHNIHVHNDSSSDIDLVESVNKADETEIFGNPIT